MVLVWIEEVAMASKLAEPQAYEAGGLFREGPYTIVGTQLERALVTDMMRAPWGVDRGIQTIVVPSEMLPRLAPPTVLPYTPIPKVH